MNYSFKLKHPKSDAETLIYFCVFFKDEGKSFIYSTGEKIHPNSWNFKDKRPENLSGRKNDAEIRRSIDSQLSRYSNFFMEITNRFKMVNEVLTVEKIRNEFDSEFKKVSKKTNDFFNVYDLFLKEKENDKTDQANTPSTIQRYKSNKNLLKGFQKTTGYYLTFNAINKKFFNLFVNYCVEEKNHCSNTLARNVGLFKTFLVFALENKFTYNDEYKKFPIIKRFATDEVALTIDDINNIYNYDLKGNKRLIRIRDLFVFACVTGFRYSNYSKIKKNDIIDGFIRVLDDKDKTKLLSVPLNKFSLEILEKYDYNLPTISNQKLNDYVKELFEEMKYEKPIKKTMKYGNEIIETESPLYKRISSHTARRSFITIMKNKSIPDKVIMSYTGHKSFEVFNNYYRPNEEHKINFMNNVFG